MVKESLTHLKSSLGPKIITSERQYLYFGGTAYLGIPQSEEFLKLFIEGIKKYGLNNGTSRANNVQLGIYDEAENTAALRFGFDAALITSSGYLAAQLAINQLKKFGEVRYAPDTHPALWIENSPEIIQSFALWAINITEEINTSKISNWVLITNSMNNLYPERYDFSFLSRINKKVTILIDDSHGIGVNNNGLGILPDLPICQHVEVIVLGSMAKALGIDAGIILGSQKIIDSLKLSHEFLGASPPAAAGLYAFIHGAEIYDNALGKLKNNMDLLNDSFYNNNNWEFIKDFPVYLAKNTDLSDKLNNKGILISSFPYPKKDSPIVNRIVLNSWHSELDIQMLLKALN